MSEKTRRPLWLAALTAYLSYTSIYIARLNFSVASALLESGGILDKVQIGAIGGIFSFCYAVSKIPNGYLGDRKPTKRVIICGLVIAGGSNILIGLFPSWWSIALLWGLNAYGQSMLWGPILRSFSENYSAAQFKSVCNMLTTSIAIGGIIGVSAASKCAELFGVAGCFIIPGAAALAMAFFTGAFFVNADGKDEDGGRSLAGSLGFILQNKSFRSVVFPAVAHGMIRDNVNIWMALYLIDTYHADVEGIAGYIFFIPAFALLGRVAFPVLARFIKSEYLISSTAFLACAAVSSALCLKGLPIFCAALCLGAVSALVSIVNTHLAIVFPAEFSESGNISLSSGVIDCITYGGAGLGSFIFGLLIKRQGYAGMFMIWAALSLISALLLLKSLSHKRAGTPS